MLRRCVRKVEVQRRWQERGTSLPCKRRCDGLQWDVIRNPEQPRSEAVSLATSDVKAAAQRWLSEHGDVLWRFACSRVKSREVAEEIVQETILGAMQSFASFAGHSSERTWLLGIAAHKIADHVRAERRRRGVNEAKDTPLETVRSPEEDSFEAMFTPAGKWATLPAAWGKDTDSAAENAELLKALRHCVEDLPPALAEAVWMRDLLNIPATEVCKSLGLTATNLWTRTHRARAALRTCVERVAGLRKEGRR